MRTPALGWGPRIIETAGEPEAALVVNLLGFSALVVDAGVAVGSADSSQCGPMRVRGGASGERWRSGPVRSRSNGGLARRAATGGAVIIARRGAWRRRPVRRPRRWGSNSNGEKNNDLHPNA